MLLLLDAFYRKSTGCRYFERNTRSRICHICFHAALQQPRCTVPLRQSPGVRHLNPEGAAPGPGPHPAGPPALRAQPGDSHDPITFQLLHLGFQFLLPEDEIL